MEPSIGLVTLNAKFIHTSISLRYLRNAARRAGFENVWIREFVINQPVWKIAAEIQRRKPDVLGVSVYIWNRAQCLELIERLKKQNPSLTIVMGGPEVSFEPSPLPGGITIAGEGETKWVELLNYVKRGESPPPEALKRWNTYGTDLPELVPPYIEEDYSGLKHRVAYIETSRGCPYLCSFCLSALDKTVRYFDDHEIRRQIEILIAAGVRHVKFVDRTFNLKPARMKELMGWLSRFRGASFHFEVVGDILTGDMMDFLETVPEGMFQFEIGIQTTTPSVQETIQRRQDNRRLFEAVERLVRQDRVHLHCDLIFGLPGETVDEIFRSFTEVFELKPHELQLGFLKFLPGAPIRDLIESHGYEFQSVPPYELISNRDLSADEVIHLKMFAEVFDLFYNSKRFRFSIDALRKTIPPVEIFQRLLEYVQSRDLFLQSFSLDDQYRIFFETFSLDNNAEGLDLLKLDYLYAQRVYRLPRFLRDRLPRETGTRTRTWKGDGKTPLVAFQHEIRLARSEVELSPASRPLHYAVVHPAENGGYWNRPTLERAAG